MTKIQWTDITENPLKRADGGNYCELKSPGCKNCYASILNSKGTRFGGNGLAFSGKNQARPEMKLNTEMMAKWSRMRKPKTHFIGSMTDIFGEWVEDKYIYEMLDNMRAAPLQIFQLLTKRPERLPGLLEYWLGYNGLAQLPANIWLGTSAEDQKRLDERLPWLIRARAHVRFLSLEPLLGPISLPDNGNCEVNWVIIGGESGPNARPMSLVWVTDILAQCRAANIPAFVKQLGEVWSKKNVAKHNKGGDPDEWPAYLRVRMMPGEKSKFIERMEK